jgi:hypothetical protein
MAWHLPRDHQGRNISLRRRNLKEKRNQSIMTKRYYKLEPSRNMKLYGARCSLMSVKKPEKLALEKRETKWNLTTAKTHETGNTTSM